MKKTVVMLLTVVFMLSMLCVFASAESYSDELVSFDIPKIFSSKTDSLIDGSDFVQWTNPETSSSISLTVEENSLNVSYVDMTDVQLQAFKSSYVSQFTKETEDGLELYSIGFKVVDSKAESVDVYGTKGTRLDMRIEYSYSDGEVVPADLMVCCFSTAEKTIVLSGLSKTDEEKEAVEDFVSSIVIKGEIYVRRDNTPIIVSFALVIIGGIVGGVVGIVTSVSKKKKQKLQAMQRPVQYPANGAMPYQPNGMSQGYGVPNQPNNMGQGYGVPNQPNNIAPNQPYNAYPSQNFTNPNNNTN